MNALRLALRWAAQVAPPLLLLVLFVSPWDSVAALPWLAGAIAVLASLSTLARLALARWRAPQTGDRPAGDARPGPSPAIRPALTVAIFIVAAVFMAERSARFAEESDALGREIAAWATSVCARDGRCPAAPDGWEMRGERACRAIGFMRVCYRPGDDGLTFLVQVRHRLDDYLDLAGGVGREVSEQRVCC